MDGKLPEIYWYVFWVGFVFASFGFMMWAGRGEHERRHKALDILRIYAEKGAEPPPAVMDQLVSQANADRASGPTQGGRAALMRGFIGFLFSACVASGLHYWFAEDGPRWAVIASQAAMAFFGFGAFGMLLAALVTREK